MSAEALAELNEQQLTVLTMLSDELADNREAYDQFAVEMQSADQFDEAKERYLQQLSFLKDTGEMLGLEGLVKVSQKISGNIEQASHPLSAELFAALGGWPDYLLKYLENPLDDQVCLALLGHLELACWPRPTTGDESKALLKQLVNIELSAFDDGEVEDEQRTEVTDADVVLTPDADVNQEVLDSFLQDAPQQAEGLFEAVSQLLHYAATEAGEDASDEIQSQINIAQRISHTLKGAANLLSIKAVANISHELERILESLADSGTPPSSADSQLMIEAADCIGAMVDFLLGMDHAPENRKELLLRLSQWPSAEELFEDDATAESNDPFADIEAFAALDEILEPELASPPLAAVSEFPIEPEAASAEEAFPAEETFPAEELRAEVAPEPKIEAVVTPKASPAPTPKAESAAAPSGEQAIDGMLSLAENMNINMVQSKELYKRISDTLLAMRKQELNIQERRFDLENLVDGRSMARPQIRYEESPEVDFDPLEMDRYDELHLSTHQFIEAVSDARGITHKLQDQLGMFDSLIQQQQRYTDSVQHLILQSKQFPVSQFSSRLQRCVRQAGQMAKKTVDLTLVGESVAIDKDMMNQLIDSIMHLLRNAVDHGIEAADLRTASNKRPAGMIELSFTTDGQHLVIQSRDDGAGLNYDSIYQTALSRGILDEKAERPSNEALAQLLFASGFTTRAQATQLSGRGIGLDAVKTTIEGLGGHITVTSDAGQGTSFTISVPMKQVTRHLIVVMVGQQRFALHSSDIVQILPSASSELVSIAGEACIDCNNKLYSYRTLGSMINRQPANTSADSAAQTGTLLLVENEQSAFAVEVDQLLNSDNLVIKKSGDYMKLLPGIDGVSILGDGVLVPVLNIRRLTSEGSTSAIGNYVDSTPSMNSNPAVQDSPAQVLVVDDSLSVRSSLEQLLSDIGYQVTTANDGIDAIEKMNAITPAVVLVDMEMPRMNGLELTQYIRHQDRLKSIPVIMLTSRSQQKHRALAEKSGVSLYKTKPYSDFDLISSLQEALEA